MTEIARLGRVATHSPKAEEMRAAARHRHVAAMKAWRSSDQPSWLTEEFYVTKVKPVLRDFTVSSIASRLGISLPYATNIRAGRCIPHQRHWQALAEFVGLSIDARLSSALRSASNSASGAPIV
jgi:hypothetical protein